MEKESNTDNKKETKRVFENISVRIKSIILIAVNLEAIQSSSVDINFHLIPKITNI